MMQLSIAYATQPFLSTDRPAAVYWHKPASATPSCVPVSHVFLIHVSDTHQLKSLNTHSV